MAIYSSVPPPPELQGSADASQQHAELPQPQSATVVAASSQIDIEAWTVSALQSLSVSADAPATIPLSIPLDEHVRSSPATKRSVRVQEPERSATTPSRRPLSRRDSMDRRDALLKGKEGSRQRRRWENDRLMHNPYFQPPEPIDYVPRPTHPVQHVPYQVAAAWDSRLRADVEAKKAAATLRKQKQTQTLGDENVSGRVPRELFVRAKKTPAVKTWVRSLEEPVRKFLVDRDVAKEAEIESDDTEDEEIVFVGRNGSMRDGWKKARREGPKDESGMLLDLLGDDDESGAFKRWISHSISDYYGLDSRSILVGNPKRKVVYVGVKQMKTGHAVGPLTTLPRPLWELC
ncbi:R3H-associated N-terminal domain-containing protein [Truncatella angustata]|uniref:R3H-associated N-terminal domain-containing protein n=1 Tax=Truncatella angustata TaxID=152316 RepID=A0A9P8UWD6_9PEZI|nr:R3H-associated N-terminal domain-containing protein [Truncatella angustata]KAH6659437.1 R3H-associated N-terminal domain-containing protein [Truncatella angustata]